MGHIIQTVADLTNHRDRNALVDTLLSVFHGLIGASRLTLWNVVRRDGGLSLRRRADFGSSGAPEADARGAGSTVPLEARPDLSRCFHSREPVFRPADEAGGLSYVFPVMSGNEVVDLLEVAPSAPLSHEQMQMITGMLRIYRNHSGILDYGDCDELTGLRNRRTFNDSFAKLGNCAGCNDSCGERRTLCARYPYLAVIDIDHFKRINDLFGHPFGDEVLVLFAGLMRECFADLERLFRFGGEEFLVLLDGATMEEAFDSLDRFRIKIETFRFPQVGPVTASIGYTRVTAGDTGASAFGRADAALYVAKQSGRNQVRSHEMLVADGLIQGKIAVGQDVELF
jgi:diguanylate cyclase (GGDEF)-like protein